MSLVIPGKQTTEFKLKLGLTARMCRGVVCQVPQQSGQFFHILLNTSVDADADRSERDGQANNLAIGQLLNDDIVTKLSYF